MCMYVSSACMSVSYVHAAPVEASGGRWIPTSRVRDSGELSCRFWEQNLGPVQEQPVFETTELSP